MKELDKSIKDQDHIIHDALKYRLHPINDPKTQSRLLAKLNLYLKELNSKYLK